MFFAPRSIAAAAALFSLMLMLASPSAVAIEPQSCEELLASYHQQAAADDAVAQRKLGGMYFNGYCVEQSHAYALEWYTKAANGGDGKAMLELGNIYGRGYGVKPDLEQTLNWLQKAEAQGEATGRVYGFLYLDGALVLRSIGRAYSFFLQAAEQGDPAAQYTVGLEYLNGRHLSKNSSRGMYWLTQSAGNGYGPAYRVLGGIYAYGSYGVQRNTARADKWFALARHESTAAALDIAEMYMEGRGVHRDIDKAISYYMELAARYVADAHLMLGVIYSTGPQSKRDYHLASEHFEVAEKLGSAEAAYHLGLLHLNGHGRPKNRAAAQDMFARSVANGYRFANFYLGLMAYNSWNRSSYEALEYFARAAQAEDPNLAAQAYRAKNALEIEMGLISGSRYLARLDNWNGTLPGREFVYTHRPFKEPLPALAPDTAMADAGPAGAAQRELPSYEPPPPPLLRDIPGGEVNTVDRTINTVFN